MQMAWEVDDLEATVKEVRRRGVVFHEYDTRPENRRRHRGNHGNYPSKGGVGEKAAWFRDSEGNLLGIGQAIR
jgi:hypothetical protein